MRYAVAIARSSVEATPMSDRIYLGTRKGLLTLDRRPAGWELSRVDFLGEPVTMLLRDPRDTSIYACLTLGHFGVKLHRSHDDGQNWEECGVPVFPEGAEVGLGPFAEDGPQTKPASLGEIWSLEAGGSDQPGRLWAGTIPGGLFQSDDHGSTWQLVESLWNREERMRWFGGGKDDPGIHSICVDSRDSRRLSLGVSCGGVWFSEDDGTSWNLRADGIRADYVPPGLTDDPAIQDVHRLVQAPTDPNVYWAQHHNGIFHTTNGGMVWSEITEAGPSTFGFAAAVHPHDPGTAWFVPGVKDECRVPVDAQFVVTRTRDGGQSFDVLRDGLPQEHCYDIVFRHGLDVDESGDRLACGSSTGGLWISEDGGEQWDCFSTTLPQIYCVRFQPESSS